MLVPDAFEVLLGTGEVRLHTAGSPRASGQSWMKELADGLLQRDTDDWAVANRGSEARFLRVPLTRLKPAVRATVSETGHDPLGVWAATWSDLVALLRTDHAPWASDLQQIIDILGLHEEQRWNAGRLILDLLAVLSAAASSR